MLIEILEARMLLSTAPTGRLPPSRALALPDRPQVVGRALDVQNSQGGVTVYPTVGQPFTGTVGSFKLSAPPPSGLQTGASIDWGDGANSPGQIAPNQAGSYEVIGTHLYRSAGTFAIVVRVSQRPLCNGTGPCPEFIILVTTINSTAVARPLPGDANGDGKVDFADLLMLAQNYGLPKGATYMTGDFNGDGSVGFDDLLILAQNYGKTLAAAGSKAKHRLAAFVLNKAL